MKPSYVVGKTEGKLEPGKDDLNIARMSTAMAKGTTTKNAQIPK